MGETGLQKAMLAHLVLGLSVNYSRGVAVDDTEVGLGDFLGKGVAVDGRRVEHEALASVVPLLCLVLLSHILLLDVI